MKTRRLSLMAVSLWIAINVLSAAPADRITRPVDSRRLTILPGHVHRLARVEFDHGPVAPQTEMGHLIILFKLSANQQAELDGLLADQQNPSSPHFREWLTPEQFADRFGVSASDESKVVAWLNSQGFQVEHRSRARNWVR